MKTDIRMMPEADFKSCKKAGASPWTSEKKYSVPFGKYNFAFKDITTQRSQP